MVKIGQWYYVTYAFRHFPFGQFWAPDEERYHPPECPPEFPAYLRANATLSGLADARIRWLAEDARVFVSRELRRGQKYSLVALDPPSYGHGPKGQSWKIDKHLQELLADCFQLLADRRQHCC